MEPNTLSLEEIWDQLSLSHIRVFKVQMVFPSDQHEERNLKDSNSWTGGTESICQINSIDFGVNGMHCKLIDRKVGRQTRTILTKRRKVSLQRKPKTRYATLLYFLLVLLFLTNICCVCFPVSPPSNSSAYLEIASKDVVSPVQHWVPVEATFANLHLKYNILIPSNPTNHCNDAELFVFIAIRSHSFDIRQIIRSAWANPENIGNKTVEKFAIGHLNDELTMQQLFEEQETFNDLILYDHPDEYRQLYIKIHATFNWQQKVCPNVKYIFRADDDIVVDLPRLRYWIDKEMSVAKKR
ncbi:galactosyltransferase domain-containing protein [Ditylenchus destructor]|nr:galactosyltransferase domain-containing protein [Ditylenchus destructor]